MPTKKKTCFVSIDVEHDHDSDGEARRFKGVDVLDKVLGIFRDKEVEATLFVTGEALERYRDKLAKLSGSYEIACHSFTHQFWNTLDKEERKEEVGKFISLYKDVFKKVPLGFRAPSHVIDIEGIQLLEESGFKYDSSIVPHYPPFKKYRGYRGRAPLLPYRPQGINILEIPVSGQLMGLPLAGAWIRGLPVLLYRALFMIYRPSFITLSMHSWDALYPEFAGKLAKILDILKGGGYTFENGEQILKNRG